MRSIGWVLSVASVFTAFACSESKQDTPPPGPPAPKASSAPPATSTTAATPGIDAHVCAAGAGENPDAESASIFPSLVAPAGGIKFCLKPKGEVFSYGEKAKLPMDKVCTNAFDGECEIYKQFGLKRVVTLTYVDDPGKGVNVECVLSRFATADGAYGMFTKRVVADGDPKGEGVPKPLAAGAAGAIGTGRAYVVRGTYLVELQYNSDSESPQQLAASSLKALTAIGHDIGEKLPGEAVVPTSAKALPADGLVPNGVQYLMKDVPGFGAIGPAAFGFYDQAGVRTRVLSVVRSSEGDAKTAFGVIKAKGKPVAGVGDEAVVVSVGDAQKVDYVVARKGARIVGVGDEEFALKSGGKPVGADALTERAKKLVAAP
jgi:hypothetical protein